MPEQQGCTIRINGLTVQVALGTMVSAALLQTNTPFRTSVSGQPRSAVCGMGICFECRAIVDGVPHQRTCQLPCRNGMEIETNR